MGNHPTFGESGGGGTAVAGVASVTAGDLSIVVGGTPTNPTVRANELDSGQPVGQKNAPVLVQVAPADHGHATLVAANAAALTALVVTGMLDGTVGHVTSRDAVFVLTTSALATDGVDVLASATAGRRWLRRVVRSTKWCAETDWNVDTGAGSDDNTGRAGSPLKTMAECARRLFDAVYPIASGAGCVVKLTGDMAAGDSGHFFVRGTGNFSSGAVTPLGVDTAFQILGQPTDLGFAGVVGGVQNGALGSLLDIHFTDAGIPVSFTASGFLARNVIFRRTNGTVCRWWPAKDLGAKTLRVSQPNATFGAYPALANADTYRVDQLPRIHDISFWRSNAEQTDFGVALCSYTGATEPSSMPVLWSECSFESAAIMSGNFFNCQFPSAFSFGSSLLTGGGQIVSGCVRGGAATTNGRFTIADDGPWLLSNEDGGFITAQGCQLIVDVNGRALRAQIQFFDATVAAMSGNVGSATSIIAVGGAGNTSKIYSTVNVDAYFAYDNLPNAGMTTDANPYKALGNSQATPFSVPGANIYQTPANAVGTGFKPVANGAVVVALGAFGPAGSSATPTRWVDIPDGAGGFFRLASYL